MYFNFFFLKIPRAREFLLPGLEYVTHNR